MLYARQPTVEEHRELKRMIRQEVGRVSQRAHMVLLSVRRKTVSEIADIFAISQATGRFWIRRFNALGPAGLCDEERSGRPGKCTSTVEESVVEMVEDDPPKEGYLATFWSVAMLVLALTHKLGITLGSTTLREALHRIGLRWGRPRLGMPDKVDPKKAQKQWAIAKAVVEAPTDAAVVYADESRVQLLPLIRGMWHWVGQQIRIPTPGTNVAQVVFGALSIRTGHWTYLIRERMRKEDFIAFLEHLLIVYPSGSIILIIDNFSSHKAHLVRTWSALHPRLQLHYLPTYCSHLNPVEGIWLRLKSSIAANRLYGSMELLLEAVATFFEQMTPQKALTWAAA